MTTIQETLTALPHVPGVYIYKNAVGQIIYVGKAIDLAHRVKQYFQRDDALGAKTPRLVAEIAKIETHETESEFDALLLEARLIKQHQPKYNSIAKDDKSPLYVAISIGEKLPRVYFTRKPKETVIQSHIAYRTAQNDERILYFGPFQSARAARQLMRSLRCVVPYCTQKLRNGKRCFYTHLALCDPCPSVIAKLDDVQQKADLTKHYRKHIFRLRDILSGKAAMVVASMEREMIHLSDAMAFEAAALVRNQMVTLRTLLQKRYDPSLYVQSDTLLSELLEKETQELKTILLPYYPRLATLERIECFDISNTSGTNATASMVVATAGRIDKDEYRRFKIRTKQTPNDTAMMAEALTRRFAHPEWTYPDLLVVDGGKSQITSATTILSNLESLLPTVALAKGGISNLDIAIIGLAKREEEIIIPMQDGWKVVRLPFSSGALKLLMRLRDEAHRFAKKYHTHLRAKTALENRTVRRN